MGSLKTLFDESDNREKRRRRITVEERKARIAERFEKHDRIARQLDDKIAELDALRSAAFSLYQHAFPDYTPTHHQLGTVGYLIKKYGEEKLLEVFLYAGAREDMDPAAVHRYIWACLKRGF